MEADCPSSIPIRSFISGDTYNAYYSPSQDGGVTASFKAEFDKVNKLQKTNTVKLEGTSHSTIQVPLQNNVTLYNVTKGTMQTGGTVTVNGGESFYLTAPCKNSPENYKSGSKFHEPTAPYQYAQLAFFLFPKLKESLERFFRFR